LYDDILNNITEISGEEWLLFGCLSAEFPPSGGVLFVANPVEKRSKRKIIGEVSHARLASYPRNS
jgi:hypothetical protein